ncbi:cytochrome P450 [Streptacidiphilus sp. P02-A3a]|uniref:cytochrome P450 family protein n=1 Tax=Streptacidiphilus sp. P02-A3a TaxID=2704468 RepID=UPI0015F85D7E|nr:cytochrome P450 [Streptacidiphilus sp. P02-A3a]QMU70619.1 cytochrome P450 [Streptacidiphilus sp. P02-A3a]
MTGSVPAHFDGDLLADPHGGYARLRQAGPVHRTTTPDGAPVWLVTRYPDVRAALADPRLSLDKRSARSGGEHGASMPPELDAHLLNLDPPDHTRLRRLVAKAFTPRGIDRLRPLVQARTDALLDRLTGPADLMSALATPLTMAVICDLLGIAEAERRDFQRWTDTLRSPAADAATASRAALGQMHRFLTGLIAEKRARPGDDLLTRMIAARDQQDRLSEPELVALTFLILFAGYDNSANLIGSALLALLTHPEALRELRAGALRMDQLLDETLRWNSPSMLASRRFTREEVEIGGVRIPAGERIWLSLVSANRDERQFADPAAFRPTRDGAHLGLGHGIHYCLGAALARLEAEVAIGAVVRRFPRLRLARPASELGWDASFRNRALRELPVTW